MIATNKRSLHSVYGRKQDRYLELVRRFPLRPISDDAELDDAIRVINSLLDKGKLALPEQDYLDVLSDLVEAYEEVNVRFDDPTDAEMLKYLMELKEMSQIELARKIRITESTVSEILAGKRKLNRGQIGKLSAFFGVSPDVFDFSA